MPKPKIKWIFASKICRRAFTPERTPMVRNHPAPRLIRRMTGMRGSIAAGDVGAPGVVPPGFSDMVPPGNTKETFRLRMLYCYAKLLAQSSKIFRRPGRGGLPSTYPGCDRVKPVDRRLPGWIVWLEACCKVFTPGGGSAGYVRTHTNGFSVPSRCFCPAHHSFSLVWRSLRLRV